MTYSHIKEVIDHSAISPHLQRISEKVFSQERITVEECVLLYENGEPAFLGALANYVREKKHGNKTFFNRNFHIEPTNFCVFDCKFCSYSRFLRERGDTNSWELWEEDIIKIIKEYENSGVTEVHIVGGVHPKMDLEYFGKILRRIKEMRPALHIKAFTAVELDYMFRKAKVSVEEGLLFLKKNGLNSLPGGGAEIFDEEIREQICKDKCDSDQWLNIHETAHRLDIPSNATMLYGHIESYNHRADHMDRLRTLQDKTGGFNAFIPLKFRNKDNQMSDIPESSVIEDLKNYAVARIFLDNFDHIKAYWPMIGRDIAQMSLGFGVNDMDGTIDDTTKIYSMAGAEEQHPSMTTEQIIALIRGAGREAVERDTLYKVVRDYGNLCEQ